MSCWKNITKDVALNIDHLQRVCLEGLLTVQGVHISCVRFGLRPARCQREGSANRQQCYYCFVKAKKTPGTSLQALFVC